MNCKLTNVLFFVAGAAIGAFATWQTIKDHYAQISEEEIESVKDMYMRKMQIQEDKNTIVDDEPEPPKPHVPEKPDIMEYAAKLQKHKYTNYSGDTSIPEQDIKEGNEDVLDKKPRVISPDEFGEEGDYETATLFYFNDGMITDDDQDPISDDEIKEMIGEDAVNHFGEYEDDSVFVVNDELKCYYELLKQEENYVEPGVPTRERRPDELSEEEANE